MSTIKHKINLCGVWNVSAYKPFIISDVAKASFILQKKSIPSNIIQPYGILTYKNFLNHIQPNIKQLSELESLIFGGSVRWNECVENLIVNVGLNYLLDSAISAATVVTTWYVGLIDGSSPTIAAGNTMSSHAWTENVAYSESVRQTFVDAGASSQSLTNSASPALFTCNTNSQTIGGCFLTSNSTKSGTTGTLFSAKAFSSAKALDSSDTISCTYTLSATSS